MIALILLAAGRGARFGSDKLLYPIDGKPMYRHCLDRLIEIGTERALPVLAVVHEGPLRKEIQSLPVQVVCNSQSHLGLSTSLRAALKVLPDSVEAAAFFAADQPWLSTAAIRRLLDGYIQDERGIACASRHGRPGNPAIFSRRYFPVLHSLEGDIGGRSVILENLSDCTLIDISNAELRDVDRPSDMYLQDRHH